MLHMRRAHIHSKRLTGVRRKVHASSVCLCGAKVHTYCAPVRARKRPPFCDLVCHVAAVCVYSHVIFPTTRVTAIMGKGGHANGPKHAPTTVCSWCECVMAAAAVQASDDTVDDDGFRLSVAGYHSLSTQFRLVSNLKLRRTKRNEQIIGRLPVAAYACTLWC